MISVWSSTEDCNGSKEVVSKGKGRETGSRVSKLLCNNPLRVTNGRSNE